MTPLKPWTPKPGGRRYCTDCGSLLVPDTRHATYDSHTGMPLYPNHDCPQCSNAYCTAHRYPRPYTGD